MKSDLKTKNLSLWRVLFSTSRPLSWINTAYPFAVAYWVLTREVDWYLVIGTIFFLVPYNLFMYGLNDVFDYDSDLRNPRKGGVEGAIVAKQFHRSILWAILATCVPFVVLLGYGANLATTVALLFVLFMVAAYSAPYLRFKEIPFLDSATSATHFVGPAVVGVFAAAARHLNLEITAKTVLILIAFFIWGMASQAFGAVQDVVPDRKAKISSIATTIGAAETVRTSMWLYVLCALLLVIRGGAALWAVPLALLYALNVLPWRNVTDKRSGKTHRSWVVFLWLNYFVGFWLTMIIIAAVNDWISA